MVSILYFAFFIYPIIKFIRWIALRNGWQESPEITKIFKVMDIILKVFAIFILFLFLIGLGICFGYMK